MTRWFERLNNNLQARLVFVDSRDGELERLDSTRRAGRFFSCRVGF